MTSNHGEESGTHTRADRPSGPRVSPRRSPIRIALLMASLAGAFASASCGEVWVLELEIAGDGIGRVQTSDGQFQCAQVERGVPVTCIEDYREGLSVQLIVDEEDAVLIEWSGACAGNAKSCAVALSDDHFVSVTFGARTFDVTAQPTGDGKGVVRFPGGSECSMDGAVATGSCTVPFVKDDTLEIVAEAATGSMLDGFVGCSSESTGDTCTVFLSESTTISVAFTSLERQLEVRAAGNGSGIVTSSPAGVVCSVEGGVADTAGCVGSFQVGTTVTLSAQPSTGSVFSGWSGPCAGSGSTCTVVMDVAGTVTASFSLLEQTLTVTATGNGSGRVTSTPAGIDCTVVDGVPLPGSGSTCVAQFDLGAQVALTVVPDEGSEPGAWAGCDGGSGATCSLTMTGDRQATAELTLTQHTLDVVLVGVGDGGVASAPGAIDCTLLDGSTSGTCSDVFDYGTSVRLTAVEAAGSSLGSWSEPSCSGVVCDVAITEDRTVTVEFVDIPLYTLSVTGLGSGTGRVVSSPAGIDCVLVAGSPETGADCSEGFDPGEIVTLTATPDVGSQFGQWSGACGGTLDCQVTMSQTRVANARFEAVTWTVSVVADGPADGTILSDPAGIDCEIVAGVATGPACTFGFPHGTPVTLEADPGVGAAFAGWSGPCSGTSVCGFTVTTNAQVTARFEEAVWTLTIMGEGTGTGAVTGPGLACSIDDGMEANDCSEQFQHGTAVTLEATEGAQTRFVGWSGGCTGSSSCALTVDQDLAVSATFARQHAITVAGGGSGSGNVTSAPSGIDCSIASGVPSGTCQAVFDEEANVVLTATGSGFSALDEWQDCDGVDGFECTVVPVSSRQVTAVFGDPAMELSTAAVSAAATFNGADPRVRRVRVYNIGAGTIGNLSYAVSPPAPWLDLSWEGGSTTAAPTATLLVQPLTGSLPLGQVSTTVTVTGSGVPSRSFEVDFEVIRGVTQEAAAERLFMHALTQAGIQTDTAFLTIRNSGRARLTNLTASVPPGGDPEGMLIGYEFIPSDAPSVLRVIGQCGSGEDPPGVELPGFCESELVWTGDGIIPQSVIVSFTFNADPELRVEPQGVTLNAFVGGPPVSATVEMIDENPTADGSLVNFQLLPTDPQLLDEWLTADRANTAVTITADPSGSTAETSDTIVVQMRAERDYDDNGEGDGDFSSDSLRVILIVQRAFEVSLTEVDLWVPEGGAAETVEVELSNGSALPLQGLAVVTSQPWLSADLGGASVLEAGGNGVTLAVTANPSALASGTYDATVTISSTTLGVPDEVITVRVNVF